MRGFLKSGLLCKKSTREYYWNRSGKFLLSENIHDFVKEAMYGNLDFSGIIQINRR